MFALSRQVPPRVRDTILTGSLTFGVSVCAMHTLLRIQLEHFPTGAPKILAVGTEICHPIVFRRTIVRPAHV